MEMVFWALVFTFGFAGIFVLGLYLIVLFGFGFFELLRKIGLIA